MATNVYFSPKVKTEQNLYEDLVIESLKMYGQDVIYIPRQLISRDEIMNEDYSKFTDGYTIEMYIETSEGFAGEGDLLGKFGVEIRDQATFVVSRKRWENLVGFYNNSINDTRPSEGDLVFLPLSKSLFEIRFVEHEQPFYQLNNLPTYKLECELFEYNNEELETGIREIDELQERFSYQLEFTMNNGSGHFAPGETVRQDTGLVDSNSQPIYVTAEVVQFVVTASTGVLTLINEIGSDGTARKFKISQLAADILTGVDSGATWYFNQDADDQAMKGDVFAQNKDFETDGDSIIDFSESNPFGEIT
ncbi:MAG: hypothetical protein CMB98_06865 [Flavobacteriaceae bacterium]|nr:hypothetical protein [Flavobacteriaceae bacterium]|tara:strand:- start:2971 stop:3888 length:918 start_codon:yes stop_codon:yes gene_type:complete